MARNARVLLKNCPHYIVQYSHNHKKIFKETEDYEHYIHSLKEWKLILGIKLYAWCILKNGVHLIVNPGEDEGNISLLMKHVSSRQTSYTNRCNGWRGTLWEGRYKSSPIQKEKYLLSSMLYVDLMPIKSGYVKQPQDYAWSSLRERLGLENNFLVDTDTIYRKLGENSSTRNEAYRDLLEQGVSRNDKELIEYALRSKKLLGDRSFLDKVEKQVGFSVDIKKRGRPAKSPKVVEESVV